MARVKIDSEWKRKVCTCLKNNHFSWTNEGKRRFEDTFTNCFAYQVEDTFRETLGSGKEIEGCYKDLSLKPRYPGPYTAYDFFFHFPYSSCQNQTLLYGKIGLHKSKNSVLILSAHVPLKGDKLSCD